MPNKINEQLIDKPNQPNMDADALAASLAFATKLSEDMLPESLQTQETAPGQAKQGQNAPEDKNTSEANLEAKFEVFKEDMEDMVKKEISSLKDIIKEALGDDIKEDGKQE